MRKRTGLLLALITGVFGLYLSYAGQEPKPANADAQLTPEAKARAEYEAAEKAAQEAEAALVPLRDAMRKAETAYADAKSAASAKRQQATEAKNLAGEEGVKMLQQAEAALATAVKALADATAAKPAAEQALTEARAAVRPLQEAYEAAEKAAQEAESRAKAAADAVEKIEQEARIATAQATALRKAAEAAKAELPKVRQRQQELEKQAAAAAQKLSEAQSQKNSADAALAAAKEALAAATAAVPAADKAAREAEAKARQAAGDAKKSDAEKKQAADEAAARRKALEEARAALPRAKAALQSAENQAKAAAQKLSEAQAEKKAADEALAAANNQIAAAATLAQAAEAAAKAAEQKNRVAEQVAAKRKALADAAAAVARAEQAERDAQAKAAEAAQKLAAAESQKKAADEALARARQQTVSATAAAEAAEKAAQEAEAKAKQIAGDASTPQAQKQQAANEAAARRKAAQEAKSALSKAQQAQQQAEAQAAAAAQKLSEALAQKKAAEDSLAKAKNELAAAVAADQAARDAAKELAQLEEASRQAAAEAAEKRKAALQARTALNPVRQKFEQAAMQANSAAQTLTRAEEQRKAAEQALENLKKQIAAAKENLQALEEAARQAEAGLQPLQQEAEKRRAEYLAGKKVADEKRALADRAKAALNRLLAARQLPLVMESPEPPKPANRIDELVFAKLNALGIKPALCSDAVFVRRAYLDVTGRLPSAEQARAFILDKNPNKRAALIDHLLDQPAHFDYWAMKWSDILRIKAEFPVKVWPNGAQAYYRWVWESLANNKPYDQFARELLTSSGSNFRVGPVNFYRAMQDRTPEGIAAAVALTLMGTRSELWPQERRAGMAVFFSQVGYKPTSEWKEEIVFWDPLKSTAVPGSISPGIDAVAKSVTETNQIPQGLAEPLSPNPPLEGVLPNGTRLTIPPDRDPREVFADWLIRPENPWFAKAIVNRTWAWIMGRGIIHEPDDIRDDNPPSNPELLAYLQKELISSGYNLKHLKRLIFTSTTYQLSSIARSNSPEAKANFASYPLRRLEAEVLIDVLNQITGTWDLYTSPVPEPFTFIPKDMPAVAIGDGSVTDSFLTLFGRSARATGMESERVNELGALQWLHMLNSLHIQNKIQNGPKLAAIISSSSQPREIVENLYLTILSRFPTDEELSIVEQYAKSGVAAGRAAWLDLAWALINSPEFLLRH